jgi:hypothetical protein
MGRNNMALKLDEDSISLRSYPRGKENDNVSVALSRKHSGRPEQQPRNFNKENIFITGNKYEKPSTPMSENKNYDNYSKYDDNLSINQVYNKNLERMRMLNNIEDNLYNYNNTELKKIGNIFEGEKYVDLDKQDNFDEFLKKLNNIKQI